MTRPLLITDCDEVLLHMVRHFGAWLAEAHDIAFAPRGGAFANAMSRNGTILPDAEAWALLDGFFATEMERQTAVPGALEALRDIATVADVVVLTNLQQWCHAGRVAQLAALGVHHRVRCNQGGKGHAVAQLVAEHGDPVTVFVDDLAVHHRSVAEVVPAVWRLHLVAEPDIADTIAPAPDAHRRIDRWEEARDWILTRFADGASALDARPATGESRP